MFEELALGEMCFRSMGTDDGMGGVELVSQVLALDELFFEGMGAIEKCFQGMGAVEKGF